MRLRVDPGRQYTGRPRAMGEAPHDRPDRQGGLGVNAGGSHEDVAPIREAVRALCAGFPGEYWRRLDRERAHPAEVVAALTKAGFLAALIPEQYGGSGLNMVAASAIMEEIHAAGCNGAACHAQMNTMGTGLRHASHVTEQRYKPQIAKGQLPLQAH